MIEALSKLIKRMRYPLSLRHIEELMAECGVFVHHATVLHRWALKITPVLVKEFHGRKPTMGESWRMDETYLSVRAANRNVCIVPWISVTASGRRARRQQSCPASGGP
jgi:transposase-like protein